MATPVLRTGNLAFYRARAAQASADAEAATLSHVRERCRRSEAAWSALADRAERSEQMRTDEQERKAMHDQVEGKDTPDGNG